MKEHRIVIVDHDSALGGAELSLEALVTGLCDEHYRYSVVLPGSGPLIDRLRKRGTTVEVVRLEGWRWWVDNSLQVFKFLFSFPLQIVSLLRWMRLLRRIRPDLVHFNINRLVEPVIAARLLRIPCIMHFRDIPSRISHRFVLGTAGFYGIMNLANHWISNSQATTRDIQPYARRPLTTIPNGLNLATFDEQTQSRSPTAARRTKYQITMIAGLIPWKNHLACLSVARLLRQTRQDITVMLAGSGESTFVNYLHTVAREWSVTDSVDFVGQVDNIPALLNNSDLLVHTTPHEPFGRVLIEAMAARKPVVAFGSGGAAEIVVDGETGILIGPDDLEGMAEAVSRLLDDAELRLRMGEAGRRRVEALYTLDQHCRAVAGVYASVLAARAAPV